MQGFAASLEYKNNNNVFVSLTNTDSIYEIVKSCTIAYKTINIYFKEKTWGFDTKC